MTLSETATAIPEKMNAPCPGYSLSPAARRAIALALWIFAASLSAFLFLRATPFGLALIGDTVDYLSTARNFLAGHGLYTLDGKGGITPLTQFPPLYPLVLATVGRITGNDIPAAARWLHLLLHMAAVVLSGLLALRLTRSVICGGIVAILAAATLPFLEADVFVMSEPLFICFILLSCITWDIAFNKQSWGWAAVTGLVVTLAATTRYTGLALLPVGAVCFLLIGRTKSQRLSLSVAFATAALIGPAAWTIRNYCAAHKATGRSIVFHLPPSGELIEGLNTIGAWLLPPLNGYSWIIGAAILILVAIIFIVAARKRSLLSTGRMPLFLLLFIYVLAHLLFLIGSRAFADANIRLRDRLLAPIFPIVIVIFTAGLFELSRRSRALKWTIALVASFIVIGNVARTAAWARRTGDVGQSYSTKRWRHSETMKFIASAPPGTTIYTNSYDTVYLLTGRNVCQLPKAHFASTDVDNPKLDAEMNGMIEQLRRTDGWVVYFNRDDRVNLLTEEALLKSARFLPLNPRQPSDGRIYRLANSQ